MPSHPLFLEVGAEVVPEEAGPPEAVEEAAGEAAGKWMLFFSPLMANSARTDLMISD